MGRAGWFGSHNVLGGCGSKETMTMRITTLQLTEYAILSF